MRTALRPTMAFVALSTCLPILTGAQDAALTRDRLLQEAWEVAQQVPDMDQRAVAMADVAVAMIPSDVDKGREYLFQAAFLAADVPTDLARTLALQAVARRIWDVDEKWAAEVLAEAVGIADEMDHPAQQSLAYMGIGLAQAETNPDAAADLLAKAAVCAGSIPDVEVHARIATMRDVSEAYRRIDAEAAQALFDEALAQATGIEAGVERDLALADLAGFIAEQSLEQAVTVVGGIADPGARSQALRDVVSHFPATEASKALELALSIAETPTRIEALADLSLNVGTEAPDVAAQAAEQATQAAAEMQADDTGNEARAAAAAAWASVDVDRALTEARAIADEYYADAAHGRIATYLAPRDLEQALGIIETIERAVVQAEPLSIAVSELAAQDADRAYELATSLRRRARVEAFLTIASHLPEAEAGGGE